MGLFISITKEKYDGQKRRKKMGMEDIFCQSDKNQFQSHKTEALLHNLQLLENDFLAGSAAPVILLCCLFLSLNPTGMFPLILVHK